MVDSTRSGCLELLSDSGMASLTTPSYVLACCVVVLSQRVSGRWIIRHSLPSSSGCSPSRHGSSHGGNGRALIERCTSRLSRLDPAADLTLKTVAVARPLVLSFFDPAMLVISADPYQSAMTVLYQRLTVIVTDVLLYYAILQSVINADSGCCCQRAYLLSLHAAQLHAPLAALPVLCLHLFVQICADSHQLGRFLLAATATNDTGANTAGHSQHGPVPHRRAIR